MGNNECEKINLYLYEFNAQKVLDIYKKILYLTIDSEQIPLNPIVLKAISNFYKLKQVCSETKFEILSYICEQSKIFETEFCVNESFFSLEWWYYENICKDSKILQKFSFFQNPFRPVFSPAANSDKQNQQNPPQNLQEAVESPENLPRQLVSATKLSF